MALNRRPQVQSDLADVIKTSFFLLFSWSNQTQGLQTRGGKRGRQGELGLNEVLYVWVEMNAYCTQITLYKMTLNIYIFNFYWPCFSNKEQKCVTTTIIKGMYSIKKVCNVPTITHSDTQYCNMRHIICTVFVQQCLKNE